MALRIIDSQVIQVGRVLRWSASPTWVAARVLLSQEECFAFLLTECKEDPWNSSQPISPAHLGLTEWQASPSAYQLALHLVSSADLKGVHASTSSKSLIKMFSRTDPRSLLKHHFLLSCRQNMTH